MSCLKRAALLLAGLCCLAVAQAQPYPSRTITLVVPVPPGGFLDFMARVISPPMSKTFGQPVVIDNKPGASGNIASTIVAKAKPDGHTLLVGYSMFHTGNPTMFANLDWDPIRDFAPVAMLSTSPHIVAVHPTLPVTSLRELVEYARANPGKVNYATPGNGSVAHVGVELFKQMTKIDLTHIPYKGSSIMMQDVLSGRVQMTVAAPTSVAQHIQTGRLRGLAMAAKKRSPLLPNLPTSEEAGYKGFELEAWSAIFAPAGTPPDAVKRLSDTLGEILATEEAKQATANAGFEVRYMNSSQLDAVVRSDIKHWSQVIRSAGITAN